MIIVTSLIPSHGNKHQQKEAIKSWLPYGECYSINNLKESIQLKEEYEGIEFVETVRTIETLYGNSPRVNINAFIDFAKEKNEDLFLINSDILIDNLPVFKQDGITIFSRYDYEDDRSKSDMFIFGFDAFFIPKHLLNIFPPSIYALGACFYDLSLPYRCIIKNIPVYYPFGKWIFHKKHEVQYSLDEWYFLGKFFRWEFRLNETMPIEHITQMAMAQIRHKLIQ